MPSGKARDRRLGGGGRVWCELAAHRRGRQRFAIRILEPHDHRRHRFSECVSVPRDPAGRHRRRHVALRRLGIALHSGDGISRASASTSGLWNSLHTGDAGSDGPSGKLWYESDFYATFGFGFGKGTSLGVTYTAYTSPNGCSTPCEELSFKFACRRQRRTGAAAIKPYVLVAHELDGQADGGAEEGTYLEIGDRAGITRWRGSTVNVPLQGQGSVLATTTRGSVGDETFGFFSVAGIVTVPLIERADASRQLEHSWRRRVL